LQTSGTEIFVPDFFLARIFHKGRRERPENAMNADSERSETFEEQRKKVRRHIVKYFEESFLRCNAAGMVFSGLIADRL